MIDTQNHKWLIVPMEIFERELNGNLLLCLEAMNAGWHCIIGSKKQIYRTAKELPDGIVFHKSIIGSEKANLQNLINCGHKIVSLDVEGLVYLSMDEFAATRFTEETMAQAEALFFWGDTQKNAVAKAYPNAASKLHTTGHPIADMWRPSMHSYYEERVNELQARYGRFILFPSVFAIPNHHMGKSANMNIMLRDKMLHGRDEEALNFWAGYEEYIDQVYQEFLKLIPEVAAAFPEHKLIVRPHPSESHESWISLAKEHPNIIVIFEGPVSPWILAADAMLHWGCTTAIEAYIMGKPVVAYQPITNPRYDHKLTHDVSINKDSIEGVIEELKKVAQGMGSHIEGQPLKDWLHEAQAGSAAEIFKVISQIEAPSAPAHFDLPKEHKPFKETVYDILAPFVKNPLLRPLWPERIKIGVDAQQYGKHKTRTLSQTHLEQALKQLSRLKNQPSIHAQKLAHNLFHLYKS